MSLPSLPQMVGRTVAVMVLHLALLPPTPARHAKPTNSNSKPWGQGWVGEATQMESSELAYMRRHSQGQGCLSSYYPCSLHTKAAATQMCRRAPWSNSSSANLRSSLTLETSSCAALVFC